MRRAVIAAAALGLGVACASEGDPDATGTTDGKGGASAAPDGPPVPLTVRLVDTLTAGGPVTVTAGDLFAPLDPPPDPEPWVGVEVCLAEPAGDCATTDAAGEAALSAPGGARIAIRATGDGMQTVIIQATTPETEGLLLAAEVPPAEVVDAFNAIADVSDGEDLGMVAVRFVEDVTASYFPTGERLLDPACCGTVSTHFEAAGLYYLDDSGLPNPDVPTNGGAPPADAPLDPAFDLPGHRGGFVAGVAPGEWTLRYGHPELECDDTVFGWAGSESGDVVARVEPGALTLSAVGCTVAEGMLSVSVADGVDGSWIEDAEICLIEPLGECLRPDPFGFRSATVPRGPYAVRVRKAGWMTTIAQGVAGMYGDGLSVRLWSEEVYQRFTPLVGPGPGQGVASVEIPAGGRVSTDTDGASVVVVTEGIFVEPDPSLRASTGNPGVVGPLPPGEHRVRFEHDRLECPRPTLGWPGDAAGEVVLLVEPGAVTAVAVECQ